MAVLGSTDYENSHITSRESRRSFEIAPCCLNQLYYPFPFACTAPLSMSPSIFSTASPLDREKSGVISRESTWLD